MPKTLLLIPAALLLWGCTAAPGPGFGISSIPDLTTNAPGSKTGTESPTPPPEDPGADYQSVSVFDLDGNGGREPILVATGRNRGSVRVAKTNALKAQLNFRASRSYTSHLTGNDAVKDLVILNDMPGGSNDYGLRVFDGARLYDDGVLQEDETLRYHAAVYGVQAWGTNFLLSVVNALLEVDSTLAEVSRKGIRAFRTADVSNESQRLFYAHTDEENCEGSGNLVPQRSFCLVAYSMSNFAVRFKMAFNAPPKLFHSAHFQDKDFDGTRERTFISDVSKTYRVYNDQDRKELLDQNGTSIPSTTVAAYGFYDPNSGHDLVIAHNGGVKLYRELNNQSDVFEVTHTWSAPGIKAAIPLRVLSSTGDMVFLYSNRIQIFAGESSSGILSFPDRFLIED